MHWPSHIERDDDGASMVCILAVCASTAMSAVVVSPVRASLVPRDEIRGKIQVRHLACRVEVDAWALEGGVRMRGSIVVVNRVRVWLNVWHQHLPVLAVIAEEVVAHLAGTAVDSLAGVVRVVDDMPVAAFINPHERILWHHALRYGSVRDVAENNPFRVCLKCWSGVHLCCM